MKFKVTHFSNKIELSGLKLYLFAVFREWYNIIIYT